MKILTCFTPSHKVFVDQFYQSLPKEDLHVIYETFDQECPTGEFAEEGWNKTTARKFEFLLSEMSKMPEGEVFTFSDIDIQFFQPLAHLAMRATAEYDIVFQNDYYGHACTGFFFVRNNAKTRAFFKEALTVIPDHRDDQAAVNHLLGIGTHDALGLKYALLPVEFFTFGCFFKHWDGEDNFPIPDQIVMHHANWVKGIDKKLELLKTVRSIYNKKNGL